jgi:uncharacterized protein YjaZ
MRLLESALHEYARKVIEWFVKKYNLECKVKVKIVLSEKMDCWGATEEGKKRNEYLIWVAKDQSLREFIATVVHEMVHVKQYERKKWSGTGEAEANRLQYKLADRMWVDGIF